MKRRSSIAALAAVLLGWSSLPAPAGAETPPQLPTIDRICDLIETHATEARIPREFLARLIWKESRFDPDAVSPVGAEGIAQFMPGTAALRGLADPFDVEQAIPASAAYLGELRDRFGNLGLAAAAYNAGENRVSRWLASGGFLPLETEDFVLDITGAPADDFTNADFEAKHEPLARDKDFDEACRELPVTRAATIPMARVPVKPWGIQIAGNFRRSAAIRQYERVRARFGSLFEGFEPVVSRVRSPIGRRGIYAVRIGVDSRADADIICQQLRGAGGSCVVLRNR